MYIVYASEHYVQVFSVVISTETERKSEGRQTEEMNAASVTQASAWQQCGLRASP